MDLNNLNPMNIAENVQKSIDSIGETVDNIHTSEEEKLNVKKEIEKVKNDVTKKIITFKEKAMEAKRDVLVQDAKSDSKLLQNWRPISILSLVFIYVMILFITYVVFRSIGYGIQIIALIKSIGESDPEVIKDMMEVGKQINEMSLQMPPKLGGIIGAIVSTFTFGKSAEIAAGRLSKNHDSNRESFK